jgi:hypothetical protein
VPPRKVQEPSVGRIVHYFVEADMQPRAALIVAVQPDGTVNLEVFGPHGVNVHRQHVPHSEEYAEDCWSWPPRA